VKQDIREAFRFLAANPGFAAVVILTLGLAIGVNSTIFSVVNGVLLRPLAYAQPDRLAGLWESNTAQGRSVPTRAAPSGSWFSVR
jgi:putative ABC transport system permease protein